MKEHADKEAEERMYVEVNTDAKMFGEGELIGVVQGILDDRRVDHKYRINNGKLEESYSYYDKGELFFQSEWEFPPNTRLDKKGERIIRLVPDCQGDEEPINEWLHTVPARHMLEDITEAWDDMKQRAKNSN